MAEVAKRFHKYWLALINCHEDKCDVAQGKSSNQILDGFLCDESFESIYGPNGR